MLLDGLVPWMIDIEDSSQVRDALRCYPFKVFIKSTAFYDQSCLLRIFHLFLFYPDAFQSAPYPPTDNGKRVLFLVVGIVFSLFQALCNAINVSIITTIVMFILYVLAISINMAVNASFWKQLKDNVE